MLLAFMHSFLGMSVSDQILHLRQLTPFPSLALVSFSMPFPLSVSYLVCCNSGLAKSTLVCSSSKNVGKEACSGVCKEQSSVSASTSRGKTSAGKAQVDNLRNIWSRLRESGLSDSAVSVVCASWRPGTQKRHASYIQRWCRYAHRRHTDLVSPTVSEPLIFLATLLYPGLGYNAICVARSAVSSYLVLKDGVPFGQQKLVIRFIRGVFEMKPALPKYSNT